MYKCNELATVTQQQEGQGRVRVVKENERKGSSQSVKYQSYFHTKSSFPVPKVS